MRTRNAKPVNRTHAKRAASKAAGWTDPSRQEQMARYRRAHGSPMAMAILTTVLFFPPLGVVAIVMACRERSCLAAGDFAGAERANNAARSWAFWAMIMGILTGLLSII